jgi:hypothetical protein
MTNGDLGWKLIEKLTSGEGLKLRGALVWSHSRNRAMTETWSGLPQVIVMIPNSVRRNPVLQHVVLLLLITACLFEGAALQAQPDLKAVSNAVRDLAVGGRSAGVVVALTGTSSEHVSPLDGLLSRELPEPLPKQISAGQLLETRLGKGRVRHLNGVPVYTDPTAAACNRLLDASVALSSSDGMFQTVVAAFNQVAGQSVGDGAMGTCLPVAFTKSSRGTEKASVVGSLKEVLTSAAAGEPGTVWVALAAQDGTCSIGLVLQEVNGGGCIVQIGDPVKVLQ